MIDDRTISAREPASYEPPAYRGTLAAHTGAAGVAAIGFIGVLGLAVLARDYLINDPTEFQATALGIIQNIAIVGWAASSVASVRETMRATAEVEDANLSQAAKKRRLVSLVISTWAPAAAIGLLPLAEAVFAMSRTVAQFIHFVH
jgi:hypothetical protein